MVDSVSECLMALLSDSKERELLKFFLSDAFRGAVRDRDSPESPIEAEGLTVRCGSHRLANPLVRRKRFEDPD